MSKKVKATSKQKSMLLLHILIFTIITVISWMTYDKGSNGHWAYPWPAWTTAAWALFVLGHYCMVYKSYDDPGYLEYRQQQGYKS